MSNENVLNTFPSNKVEALALIYCFKHSTDETSPKELVEMYNNSSTEIREAFRELRVSNSVNSSQQFRE